LDVCVVILLVGSQTFDEIFQRLFKHENFVAKMDGLMAVEIEQSLWMA
jgi:hypothetical protein